MTEEEGAREMATRAARSSTPQTDPKTTTKAPTTYFEDPELDSAGNREANAKQTAAFLKTSGYKEADILGSNYDRWTFVTTNGGKYVLSKNGKEITTVSGPPYPNTEPEVEEEEGEEEE